MGVGRVEGAHIRVMHCFAVIVMEGDLLRFGMVPLLELFCRQKLGAVGSGSFSRRVIAHCANIKKEVSSLT